MSHPVIACLLIAAFLWTGPTAWAQQPKPKQELSEDFLLQMAARNAAKLGKHETAVARYRQLLDKAPQLTEARVELGWVLLKANKLEESLAEFQRAVKDDPKDEVALRGLLEAYRKAEHKAGALEVLTKLVALLAQDRDLRTQLAVELHNQGKFEEAERHFASLIGEDKKR